MTLNKIKLYSNPWVAEIIEREGGKELPPMKCLVCHRRPCICKNKKISLHVFLQRIDGTVFIADDIREENCCRQDYILEFK